MWMINPVRCWVVHWNTICEGCAIRYDWGRRSVRADGQALVIAGSKLFIVLANKGVTTGRQTRCWNWRFVRCRRYLRRHQRWPLRRVNTDTHRHTPNKLCIFARCNLRGTLATSTPHPHIFYSVPCRFVALRLDYSSPTAIVHTSKTSQPIVVKKRSTNS